MKTIKYLTLIILAAIILNVLIIIWACTGEESPKYQKIDPEKAAYIVAGKVYRKHFVQVQEDEMKQKLIQAGEFHNLQDESWLIIWYRAAGEVFIWVHPDIEKWKAYNPGDGYPFDPDERRARR